MSVVVLVDGASDRSVAIVVSPLAELSVMLHAVTETDHHGGRGSRPDRVRESASEGLRAATLRFSPLWAAYRCRLFYLGLRSGGDAHRDLDTEIEGLRALPVARFAEFAGWACAGGHSRGVFDRLHDDLDQRRALLRSCEALSSRRVELAEHLVADPESLRSELLDLLALARDEFFDGLWRRTAPVLVQEAARLRRVVATEGVAAALVGLGAGAQLRASPSRVVFDKLTQQVVDLARDLVVLLPSVGVAPHLLAKGEPGEFAVLQYPVATVRPSATLTLSRLRVLGDPNRRRLCRLIAREALSTSEIAERCRMTPPQVSRHLRRLGELGLVQSRREGRFVYYAMDLAVVRGLGDDAVTAMLV